MTRMTGDEVREALAEGRRDFVRADLSDANLYGASLYSADLSKADLRSADLRWANLSGADLRGAKLRGASMRGANLYGANLSGANLRGADLIWADLCKADFTGAAWDETTTWPFAGLVPERSVAAAEKGGKETQMDRAVRPLTATQYHVLEALARGTRLWAEDGYYRLEHPTDGPCYTGRTRSEWREIIAGLVESKLLWWDGSARLTPAGRAVVAEQEGRKET